MRFYLSSIVTEKDNLKKKILNQKDNNNQLNDKGLSYIDKEYYNGQDKWVIFLTFIYLMKKKVMSFYSNTYSNPLGNINHSA